MTPLLKVLTDYCAIYVDDINLSEKASTNPALFARRMWNYFQPAMALFNLPTEMPEYLIGTPENPKFICPVYDNTSYITSTDENADFTVDLGENYSYYDICSCSMRQTDDFGNISLIPVNCTYNEQSNTGTVVISVASGTTIPAGTTFEFDLYADGYFVENLSPQIMNILGMCFQVVWQDRFNTDWLSMVSKVEDKSFFEQNRANKMRSDTERLEFLRKKLSEEMRRFEQNLYQKQIVQNNGLKI